MKFLPIREFDDLTTSLNFSTPDIHIIGGCDLYTTKAAGTDKKLYKSIDQSLETQYESLLRLSASLSPPQTTGFAGVDLSRNSPFGPLSQATSRKTFAYLIATLNASHPDYDFSHVLRPSDFRRERSLKSVMNNIDSTLYNLRPSPKVALDIPQYTSLNGSPPAGQGTTWGPRMWALIDREMTLKDCSVYCWAPEESVWEGEEGALWTMNYFFFNRERKRVAYFYVRGIPVMTHSPRLEFVKRQSSGMPKDSGANKRAKYWLGDKAEDATDMNADDDDEHPKNWRLEGDNEFDLNEDSDSFMSDIEFDDDCESPYEDDEDPVVDELASKKVRGVSEEVAENMEMEL